MMRRCGLSAVVAVVASVLGCAAERPLPSTEAPSAPAPRAPEAAPPASNPPVDESSEPPQLPGSTESRLLQFVGSYAPVITAGGDGYIVVEAATPHGVQWRGAPEVVSRTGSVAVVMRRALDPASQPAAVRARAGASFRLYAGGAVRCEGAGAELYELRTIEFPREDARTPDALWSLGAGGSSVAARVARAAGTCAGARWAGPGAGAPATFGGFAPADVATRAEALERVRRRRLWLDQQQNVQTMSGPHAGPQPPWDESVTVAREALVATEPASAAAASDAGPNAVRHVWVRLQGLRDPCETGGAVSAWWMVEEGRWQLVFENNSFDVGTPDAVVVIDGRPALLLRGGARVRFVDGAYRFERLPVFHDGPPC